ncbi:energy-coupled thiamine transporter ThiT [Feifania hominis]|uniref:Energy-coupled thiamine transporter ThiT n=1 Tax=Feifania hominis TaxID=2763660 RepID=A0A926HUE4_9FIRM|nr:energy-coupled thiamine transporter ThiT [Feifania hominis]MBC8536824.1 energy-coupled thiamine transporter ThiT [Feifania hominis]
MQTTRISKARVIAECGIMLAIAYVLSMFKLWEMPQGGSVTFLSMLPVLLAGYRVGPKWGLVMGFAYSLLQLVFDFRGLGVSGTALALAVVFDYLIPFTALGLAGLFKKLKYGFPIGCGVMIFVRFLCHLVSGIAVWSVWAPEGMSPFMYSLAYNGSYMGIEFVATVVVAVVLTRIDSFNKYINQTL